MKRFSSELLSGSSTFSFPCCFIPLTRKKTVYDTNGNVLPFLDEKGKNIFSYLIAKKAVSAERKRIICQEVIQKGGSPSNFRCLIKRSPLRKVMKYHALASSDREKKLYLKIGRILISNGLDVNHVDGDRNNMLYFAGLSGDLSFCRWLIRQGAFFQTSQTEDDSSLLGGVIEGYIQTPEANSKKRATYLTIAKYCQHDISTLYRKAFDYYYFIKQKEPKALSVWKKAVPGFKEIAKEHKKMKILFHALPLPPTKGEDYEVGGMFLSGLNAIHDGIFKKDFEAFFNSQFGDFIFPRTRALMSSTLDALIYNKHERLSFFKNKQVPILIDIGGIEHAAYLWIFRNRFIYVDSGGVQGVKQLFGFEECCCFGVFDRSTLTEEGLISLMSCENLQYDSPLLMELLKGLLIDKMKCNEMASSFFSYGTKSGNCVLSGLTILMSCLHYLYDSKRHQLSKKSGFCFTTSNQQFVYFLAYHYLFALFVVNRTELLSSESFLNNPEYTLFLFDIEQELTNPESSLMQMQASMKELAIYDLNRLANEQYQLALKRIQTKAV